MKSVQPQRAAPSVRGATVLIDRWMSSGDITELKTYKVMPKAANCLTATFVLLGDKEKDVDEWHELKKKFTLAKWSNDFEHRPSLLCAVCSIPGSASIYGVSDSPTLRRASRTRRWYPTRA